MKPRTLLFNALCIGALAVSLPSCLEDNVETQIMHYSPDEYATLQQTLNLPEERYDYTVSVSLGNNFGGTTLIPINSAKATLGRVLFYDNKLSQNNSVSCASCHQQSAGFADNKAQSEGFNGQLTKRNSLALASVANFESSYGGGGTVNFNQNAGFLWDERARSIVEQSQIAIEDNIEMGMTMDALADKLTQENYYRILFQKAYGSSEVTPDRITESLQEFLNAFVSNNSKFDRGLEAHFAPEVQFTNFTQQENLGKNLFVIHCSNCHDSRMAGVLVATANNGLDVTYTDQGRGAITNNVSDNGVFKVPMLRNVALTAPYMHDGRFATLEEVVEHYNSGIQEHPNLHFALRDFQTLAPKRLNLSDSEKQALVAFLRTLTDTQFAEDVRFSNPFDM